MILDQLLFEKIEPVGKSILNKANLHNPPSNYIEMYNFLSEVKKSIEAEDFDGLLIGNIFYSFVSSIEVRDRKTTARTFEDIFSALFGLKASDTQKRCNPSPTPELLALDALNDKNESWKISSDITGNKREKADIFINNYEISLKTLRGFAYDKDDKLLPKKIVMYDGDTIENSDNPELNVGSFSFRALLKGLLNEEDLSKLGDRKKGLGSGSEIRKNVLNKIKEYNKQSEFEKRLALFLKFVYDEDMYIVLKSNYKMTWYLIPSESFQKCILESYKKDEEHFESIWYRWENNNLRIHWKPIIEKLKLYKLDYKYIEFSLGKSVHSEKMNSFRNELNQEIENKIFNYLKME